MGTLEEYAKDKWAREGDSSIPLVPTVAATLYSLEISIYDHVSMSDFEVDESYEDVGLAALYDTLEKVCGCYDVDYCSMSGCYITFGLYKEDDTETTWDAINETILTYIAAARKFHEENEDD